MTTKSPAGGGGASDGSRPRCKDCGVESPRTDTNYTLIGQRHGWRLALEEEAGGRRVAHWRCPKCWERFRKISRK